MESEIFSFGVLGYSCNRKMLLPADDALVIVVVVDAGDDGDGNGGSVKKIL